MKRDIHRRLKKAEYRRAFAAVKAVIHEWDPYGLLSLGCPENEFDGEIASVVAQLPRIRSEREARDAISQVFASAFEREVFTPESCEAVGQRLFRAIEAEGFLR